MTKTFKFVQGGIEFEVTASSEHDFDEEDVFGSLVDYAADQHPQTIAAYK